MRAADLLALFDYDAWATRHIFSTAAQITAEEFVAPTRFPGGSLRGCLRHMVSAERAWLAWWQGQPPPPPLTDDDFPDVASLEARWREEAAAVRAYLATLPDADLDEVRTRPMPRLGFAIAGPLWQFIVQVTNHGTQHRSDAAQMLTDLGHSPGDLDLVVSMRRTPLGGPADAP